MSDSRSASDSQWDQDADAASLLYLTIGTTPIARVGDDGTILAGPAGLVHHYNDGSPPQPHPHPLIDEADEAHVSVDARLIALQITIIGQTVDITISSADIVTADDISTARVIIDLPDDADAETLTTLLNGDVLTAVVTTKEGAPLAAVLVSDVASLTRSSPQPAAKWRTLPPAGDVVLSTAMMTLHREDAGPAGMRLRGYAPDGTCRFTVEGHLWWFDTTTGVLLLGERSDAADHLVVVALDDAAGLDNVARLAVPGRMSDVGGASGRAVVAVYDGVDERLYQLDLTIDRSDWQLTEIPAPAGKKSIGRTCPLVFVRGSRGFGRVIDIDHSDTDDPDRIQAVSAGNAGPTLIAQRAPTPIGTLIHFHGGPESYEVDEPRMFGLVESALAAGWDWISVNYRGSLGPAADWSTSAWQSWASTLPEDLDWVLGHARQTGRIVLAGWSFGASAALALASRRPEVHGVIAGGFMADLRRHVAIACDIDPAHGPWFGRRFDLSGSDGEFFDSVSTTRPDLSILSFHGVDDPHCPYDEAMRARTAWTAAGAPWRHIDLPGGEHYAADEQDARIIRAESAAFLRELASTK